MDVARHVPTDCCGHGAKLTGCFQYNPQCDSFPIGCELYGRCIVPAMKMGCCFRWHIASPQI